MVQNPPKTQDLADQVPLEDPGVKVMINLQDSLKVISEKHTDLLDPHQTCEAGQPFLGLWQTRSYSAESETEVVSTKGPPGRGAGRGAKIKMGDLNASSQTECWDVSILLSPNLPLNLALRLPAVKTIRPARRSKTPFLGNLASPRESLENTLLKDFPKKHSSQITRLWSLQFTRPHTCTQFLKRIFFCCPLLKYEWPIKIFEASIQMTESGQSKHP